MASPSLYTAAKYSIDRFAQISVNLEIYTNTQLYAEVNFMDKTHGPLSVILENEHILWLLNDTDPKTTKKGSGFTIIKLPAEEGVLFDRTYGVIVCPLKLEIFHWNKLQWIFKTTLMDIYNMKNYITKGTFNGDLVMYQHVIIACAMRRYRAVLCKVCPLCADTNKQHEFDHSPNCFAHDRKRTKREALTALQSVTDVRLAAILESNNLPPPPQQVTVSAIIAMDKPNILSLIISHAYLPASTHLIDMHLEKEYQYYFHTA